jgi:hypothetical protein
MVLGVALGAVVPITPRASLAAIGDRQVAIMPDSGNTGYLLKGKRISKYLEWVAKEPKAH